MSTKAFSFAESDVAQVESRILEILKEKNIQKFPQTLVMQLDDLKSAEFFNSATSRTRAGKIRKSIEKFCNGLKAREYKTQAETLNESEMGEDDLIRRALIHASKVRRLSNMRSNFQRQEAELLKSIDHSESKVPFIQRDRFRSLLMELQQAVIERVEKNEDSEDEE